jgi:hypothetical protein
MSKTLHKRVDVLEGEYSNYIAAGSSLTMNQVQHAGKTILLNTAAGSTCILPAATGSGKKYRFIVQALATSNSHVIKVANATDTMQGFILSRDDTSDNAVAFFAVAGTSDTITLNRTTTGSVVVGELIEIEDVYVSSSTNRYQVTGVIANSGDPATPFSATV